MTKLRGEPAEHPLPITNTAQPADPQTLAAVVRDACAANQAIYPIGGGTSLDYGLPPKKPGWGLSLRACNRLIDYPARDMTITCQVGMTWQTLHEALAQHRQWLPVDVAQPAQATVGGAIATATSGPRRYGYGSLRDYVLGIEAVDGRGMVFHAGGRVVKNVAGYDFCKLLTGSLGTLAVITQVTLKVRPLPEVSTLLFAELSDVEHAEALLDQLAATQTTPAAIEVLCGPDWQQGGPLSGLRAAPAVRVVVGLEGTADEVAWMRRQLADETRDQGTAWHEIDAADVPAAWGQLTEFPVDRTAPLVLKINIPPSRIVEFMQTVHQMDSSASMLAHAGSGALIVRCHDLPLGELPRLLIGRLQARARRLRGSVVVLSYGGEGELTRQLCWGGAPQGAAWMRAVKAQFDPRGLLNPGRSGYESA